MQKNMVLVALGAFVVGAVVMGVVDANRPKPLFSSAFGCDRGHFLTSESAKISWQHYRRLAEEISTPPTRTFGSSTPLPGREDEYYHLLAVAKSYYNIYIEYQELAGNCEVLPALEEQAS